MHSLYISARCCGYCGEELYLQKLTPFHSLCISTPNNEINPAAVLSRSLSALRLWHNYPPAWPPSSFAQSLSCNPRRRLQTTVASLGDTDYVHFSAGHLSVHPVTVLRTSSSPGSSSNRTFSILTSRNFSTTNPCSLATSKKPRSLSCSHGL